MKILYYTNKVALIITLFLYLTIFYGLFAQFILGIIQVLSALFLYYHWSSIPEKSKKKLKLYCILSLTYLLFLVILWNNFNNKLIAIVGLFLVPIAIAVYFFIIVNELKPLKL